MTKTTRRIVIETPNFRFGYETTVVTTPDKKEIEPPAPPVRKIDIRV